MDLGSAQSKPHPRSCIIRADQHEMRIGGQARRELWPSRALLLAVLCLILFWANATSDSAFGQGIGESDVPQEHQPVEKAPESPTTPTVVQTPFNLPKTAVPALLVIDVQNCFLPGGAIPVPNGFDIIPVINRVRDTYNFRSIALSMDWHCEHHISFKTTHPGASSPVFLTYKKNTDGPPDLCDTPGAGIFTPTINCTNLHADPSDFVSFNQSLWPPHCIQNTKGANLASSLHRDDGSDYIVKKGTICDIDSYSAFEDNGGLDKTELQELLQEQGVNTVFVTGLALDVCVKFTSLDAKKLGYDVYVILDGAKPTTEDKTEPTIEILKAAGIQVVTSSQLGQVGLKRQPGRLASLIFAIPMILIAFALFGLLIRFVMKPSMAPDDPGASTTETEDDRKPLLMDQ